MNKTVTILSVGAIVMGAPGAVMAYDKVNPGLTNGWPDNGDLNNLGSAVDKVFDKVAGDISSEATKRDAADKALGGRIDQEIIDREASDKALGDRIDKEVSDRNTAIGSAVSAEKTEREAADKFIQDQVTANKNAQDEVNSKQDTKNKGFQDQITDNKAAQEAGDAKTLSEAKEHADKAASTAEKNAKDWATSEASKAEENATKKAKEYTDEKADETKTWVKGELSDQDDKITEAKKAAQGAQEEIFNEKLAREKADHDETLARETAIHNEQLAREKQVSQVYADSKKYTDQVGAETLVKANDYTDQEVGKERYERIQGDKETLEAAKNHTNQKFSQLKSMIDKNKKQANAGIAGALAASQIPQVSQGKDFSLGAGVGSYKGESSLAVGVSGRLSDRVVTRAAVTLDTTKNVGVGVGLSYEW